MYATTLGTRPLNFVFHRQMAVTNFTGDENQGIRLEQYCLKEVFMKLHGELIFLAVLNLFLAITALLGNTLILVALRRESSLSPQSKLLYRNLAITDFFVGIIVEPAYVVYLVSVVNKRHGICHYARVTCLTAAFVLCLVSLCTLTTISVERLLRLLLVRRYRQIVTYKGTCIAVIVIWVLCVVGALTQFWNPFVTFLWGFIVLILCGVTTICSYSKIFFTLRRNQVDVQMEHSHGHPIQAIPRNVALYKKAVYSALWVQVTLLVCYLPVGILRHTTQSREMSFPVYVARQITVTLVYLNSSLNPIVYCWKIRQVRRAVKDTIRQFLCSPNL